MRLLSQLREQHIDPEFVSQLDSYARCKLPVELKDAICKLIEKHCLNCGVFVNFDINSMNALSDDMRLTFVKLWKHVYSVTKMSQLLVLEVIKFLSETVEKEEVKSYICLLLFLNLILCLLLVMVKVCYNSCFSVFVALGLKNKTRYIPYVSSGSQISHIATNKGNIIRQCLLHSVLV